VARKRLLTLQGWGIAQHAIRQERQETIWENLKELHRMGIDEPGHKKFAVLEGNDIQPLIRHGYGQFFLGNVTLDDPSNDSVMTDANDGAWKCVQTGEALGIDDGAIEERHEGGPGASLLGILKGPSLVVTEVYVPGSHMTITCRLLSKLRPPSIHSRLQARHLSSPRLRQQLPSITTPSPDHARLQKLISSLERYLIRNPTPKQLDHYIHHKLDVTLPSAQHPQAVYISVISSLFRNRCAKEAIGVYQRMHNDGFVPPPHTHAEMLAIILAVGDPDPKIFATLMLVVKNPLYTEAQFVHLLDTMVKLGVPYELLNRITSEFVAARPENDKPSISLVNKLVDIKTRAGDLDDASEYLRSYETPPSSSPTALFVNILRVLSETTPSDEDALKKTLLTMQDVQVQPDIHVFNALISRELRRRSLHGFFALYHAIIQYSKATDLSPNGTTFGICFSALYKLFKPNIHAVRTLFHQSNAVPPRQLYRDMLFFHQRSSFRITGLLLHRALRAFLKVQDYAGAYVVLGSFRIFRVDLTTKTYDLVMQHVVRRAMWDVKIPRDKGETRWGDRFLGLETRAAIKNAKDWSFDQVLIERITRSASGPVFSLSGCLLDDATGECKYQIPPSVTMDSLNHGPEPSVLSVVPLQRIVRRAMAASEESGTSKERTITSRVYEAVYQAKQDIFPGKDHPYGSE